MLSAAVSAGIALFTVNRTVIHQRKVQAQRATLDMIATREVDGDFIQAKKRFNEQRDTRNGFDGFFNGEPPRELFENIRLVINDYELIATGIHAEILDEDFYRKWFRTALLKDYHALHPLIADIRTSEKTDTIYCELETLAVRWGGRPVPKRTEDPADDMPTDAPEQDDDNQAAVASA